MFLKGFPITGLNFEDLIYFPEHFIFSWQEIFDMFLVLFKSILFVRNILIISK